MLTRIIKIDPENPNTESIKKAAKILRDGGLLAFPTETVYGLGANALDKTASSRIYAAKGRPSDNPLIIHISNMEMLELVTKGSLEYAEKIANIFWPGPLTLILNKSEIVPFETTGGLDTVAVRMPSRKSANLIIEEAKLPIAAPSANISGRPSPTLASHVIEDFDGRIEGIVDDGPSPIGVESTILDITTKRPTILRRGFIRAFEIEKVLGVEVIDSISSKEVDIPKAPGMKYKHYAPKCELTVVEDILTLNTILKSTLGSKIAVMTCDENKNLYKNVKVYSLGSKENGKEIMKNLYASLRKLDEDGIEIAYSESFIDVEYGETIMERLNRACGGKVIQKNES